MIDLYITLYQILLGVAIILYVLFALSYLITTYETLSTGAPPVPSPKKKIVQALELANLDEKDKFYDLGAGWGRAVALADKKYGADATGFECSVVMSRLAKLYLFLLGSEGTITRKNFLKSPLPEEGVFYTYTSPSLMKKLEKKIKKEEPKLLKVVSYQFKFPNLEPTEVKKENEELENIYLYEIKNPA